MFKYSQACSYPRLAALLGLTPFWIGDLTFLKVDFRLYWHFSRMELHEDDVLAKAAVKFRVPSLVFQFLKNW